MTCPYKNPYFFVTTEQNRMGFSLRCIYIISFNCIILKHIQIISQYRKILMLNVRISSSFFGQPVYRWTSRPLHCYWIFNHWYLGVLLNNLVFSFTIHCMDSVHSKQRSWLTWLFLFLHMSTIHCSRQAVWWRVQCTLWSCISQSEVHVRAITRLVANSGYRAE